MAAATGVATGAESGDRNWSRVTAIAGIVFAVLFVAGWLVGLDTPAYDAGDQEWVEWFDDSGNRGQHVFSTFAMTLASLAFVVFLGGLVRRIRRGSADPDGPSLVAMGAGLVFAATTIISGVTVGAASAAVQFAPDDFPIPDADVLRMTEQLGIGIGLLGGGMAGALFVGAVALGARRTRVLPSWLVIASYVVAVLLLFSFMFVPLALLPVWVVVVSVLLLRSRTAP